MKVVRVKSQRIVKSLILTGLSLVNSDFDSARQSKVGPHENSRKHSRHDALFASIVHV